MLDSQIMYFLFCLQYFRKIYTIFIKDFASGLLGSWSLYLPSNQELEPIPLTGVINQTFQVNNIYIIEGNRNTCTSEVSAVSSVCINCINTRIEGGTPAEQVQAEEKAKGVSSKVVVELSPSQLLRIYGNKPTSPHTIIGNPPSKSVSKFRVERCKSF